MKKINRIFIYITILLIGVVVGYLINSYGISDATIKWSMGDSELEIDLKEDMVDCQTFMEKLFSTEFSREGAISWLKNNIKLYKVNDVDLADEIANLDVDEPISARLRKISRQRKGPWIYQVDTILIGVPEINDQPKVGFANVCESGKYVGQKIKIYNLLQSKSIEVFSTGRYACPDGLKYPDLQLNAKDAQELLGTSEFLKYEKAIALIVSD